MLKDSKDIRIAGCRLGYLKWSNGKMEGYTGIVVVVWTDGKEKLLYVTDNPKYRVWDGKMLIPFMEWQSKCNDSNNSIVFETARDNWDKRVGGKVRRSGGIG